MKNRLLPALFCPVISAIFLAGCTSSEPQDLGYSPAAASTSQINAASENLPAPSLAAPSPANAMPAPAAAQPEDANSVVGFPSPPPCPDPDGCAPKPVASACRTVGNVTTCDAPRDPSADDTRYTN
ncbi:hypothetical protein G6N74_06855 [Mesorhizobium sp. CGMCC 1.15528]|uniref:Uncharacterized protein n=1 Tax=Mesorhizobium zhangyense TaxID=1776730 RepID=A0A7C9R618_9HYPH|nr:hypothetical protein [Mesorhizobium zhangyense]NGN40779.1 hypothetical protein [Mesorhizobium zhangyense]